MGASPLKAAGILFAMATEVALAQCDFSTSMVDAYIQSGFPVPGALQSPQSGWRYERTGAGGNARILMTGISGGWLAGAWGSPTNQYSIPSAGPVFSPDSGLNQNTFYRRPPTFTGIMLHPGVALDHARGVLTPQAATILKSLVLRGEHLGQASVNAILTAGIQRANGTTVTLIGPTAVTRTGGAVTLSPAVGVLPISMAVGDSLFIDSGDGGSSAEDWVNVNITAQLSGAPLVATQISGGVTCAGELNAKIVAAGAQSFQWRRNGVALMDGVAPNGAVIQNATTNRLRITDFGFTDAGAYDCVVTNACGAVTAVPANFARCFADLNCDGGVDGDDVIGFFIDWDSAGIDADINDDGAVDGDDVITFFALWDAGC
jgi:hypothetical protein